MDFESPKFEQPPTPENERVIEKIEKSKILNTDQKLDLVSFCLLEDKQVALLSEFREKETAIEEIEEIKKILEFINIPYSVDRFSEIEKNIIHYAIVAGKTKENLEKFLKAVKEKDDKTMGVLLGYPETAVEAYGTEESLYFERFFAQKLPEEEQKKLEEEGILKFLYFQPSKKHWPEELNKVRKLQFLIKEKAPTLYQEIVNSETVYNVEYQKKKTKLEEIKQRVERCVDKLGEPIEEKIKDTIIFLTAFEINTTGSCEGHIDRGTGGPYIDIESKDVPELERQLEKVKRDEIEEEKIIKEIERKNLEEREKIMVLLDEFYKDRSVSYDRHLIIRPMARNWSRLESQGVDLQEIRPENIKKEKLLEYQKEILDFTEFLSKKYFGKG